MNPENVLPRTSQGAPGGGRQNQIEPDRPPVGPSDKEKTMPRLTAIDPAHAEGKTKTLLDGVRKTLGMIPNLMATLANAPAALEAYLSFGQALGRGALDAKTREAIALTGIDRIRPESCRSRWRGSRPD